ncbi:MAG: PKD domain-containing protein [Chitinophagales bacterium]|nr:PKD domain-containing protein [Chitinophagales bacterium]
MKRVILIALLSFVAWLQSSAQYCASKAIHNSNHEITFVAIYSSTGSLLSSTPCNSLVSNMTITAGAGSVLGSYCDFTSTSLTIPKLRKGNIHNLTISSTANCTNKLSGGIRVAYFDWNNDGDFTDANEKYIIDSSYSIDSVKYKAINVPTSSTTGMTRMRLVYRNVTSLSLLQPCDSNLYEGETEDYKVEIVDCKNNTVSVNPGGNVNVSVGQALTMTGSYTPGTAASFQWFKNGSPIIGRTTANLILNSITPNDTGCYKLLVTFTNGCEVYSPNTCLKMGGGAPKCSEFTKINMTTSGTSWFFSPSGPATVPAPYTVRYNWTFSNGQTSTQRNPSTTFTSFPAWAKLKVCIDSGTTTICCDSAMKDSIMNCTSNMYCNITKVGTTDSLQVNVTGGTAPRTYLWNTGSTKERIKATTTGVYSVTVTDAQGCKSTCFFTVGNSSNPCLSYRFINFSSSGKTFNFSTGVPNGANATFDWKFGNGASSSQAKPTYTYPNNGTYVVKVKFCLRDSMNNIICCDSADKAVIAVTPLPCNITANFKWTKLANGQVQFTDSTKPDTGNMYTYYWVFGDGTTSTQKNPLKTFATNGSKTVCLYVKKWMNTNNMYCMDSICKTETITNASPCNRLEPNFAWTSTGGVYTFTNTTNMTGFTLVGISYVIHNSNTTYTTANPTHTFTTNGTYTVTMTIVAFDVTTGLSCTKTVSKTFFVNTSVCGCFKAYNSFTRTANLAHFTNLSQCVDSNTKYLYKFGNGDTSSQASPNYYYPLPGLYRTVMYITRTINGVTCKDSFVRIVQITTANPCKDSGYVNNVSQPCSQFILPVCGCDTVTYKNSCFASRAGVKQWTFGPCPNDTSYVKICGYVYRDINKNCAFDTFDHPLNQITLKFNTTPVTYAYTNAAGYYQIYLPKGTYQISQVLTFRNPPVNQLCPASNAPITVAATTGGATYCNNNFYDTTSLCPDLATGIFRIATITPGFISKKAVRYANRGAVPITGVVLKYRFLSSLTVLSTTTPTYTVSGNVVTWNLGTLAPYSNGTKYVNFQTPTSLPLGTTVVDSVWIEPAGGDCDQTNNSATFNDTCVGSYDPNDKAASPAGDMAPSVKSLDYLIRFQNTGTAPAHNVRIEDKIDDNFEKASLQINDFSHKMNHYFDDNGKIYFEFPNIMLPDSGTDYEASQGYVSYSIKLKDNLPLGTKLKNTAEIYFDFNEPIITNTTVNTIVLKSSSGVQTQVNGLNVSIYPNPTQNTATFEVNLDKASSLSYTLFNIQGRLIQQKDLNKKTGQVKEEINLEGLTSGIYILNISINGKETSLKVVKE